MSVEGSLGGSRRGWHISSREGFPFGVTAVIASGLHYHTSPSEYSLGSGGMRPKRRARGRRGHQWRTTRPLGGRLLGGNTFYGINAVVCLGRSNLPFPFDFSLGKGGLRHIGVGRLAVRLRSSNDLVLRTSFGRKTELVGA